MGIPPGTTAPVPTLTLAQQGVNAGEITEKVFTENFMSFNESGGRPAPALVGYSNYLIFSIGTDYTGLKATNIQADEFYEIFILKVIHETTPVGYKTSTGQYINNSTTPTDARPLLLLQDKNADEAIGFDVLRNKNDYAPKSYISPYPRLTSFNIGAYHKTSYASKPIKFRKGMSFTNPNYVRIFDEPVLNPTTTQLSLLGRTESNFSLVSPGNLSFSGSYEGSIGKMFQCLFYVNNSQNMRKVPDAQTGCIVNAGGADAIDFTINSSGLATNSNKTGWRMIIYGSASFAPRNLMSMYMKVTLSNSSGVKINTKTCNSPCSSDQSTFKADSSANRSYQLNNFIVLDKVPPNQNILIQMKTSHELRANATTAVGGYGVGGSISVIAFPVTL